MIKREELKKKRIEKGLSQTGMSIAIGVTTNTYRNWEVGANSPSEENLVKLMKVLEN